jgi:hypothetical protein
MYIISSSTINKCMTTKTFQTNAQLVHGSKYDYSHVRYINAVTKVEIICGVHGPFFQRPNNHTSLRQGCPACDVDRKRLRATSLTMSTSDFIERSRLLYGDTLSYEKTTYSKSYSPVMLTCTIHGEFKVARAEKHLMGQGCPSCKEFGSTGVRLIVRVLVEEGVQYQREYKFDECKSDVTNRKLPFDFYLPNHHILIEFDGEQHTKESPLFHPGQRFLRMKKHDQIKTEFARGCNIPLYRFTQIDLPHLAATVKTLVK